MSDYTEGPPRQFMPRVPRMWPQQMPVIRYVETEDTDRALIIEGVDEWLKHERKTMIVEQESTTDASDRLPCNYTPTKPCVECEGLREANRRLMARVAELEALRTCDTCEHEHKTCETEQCFPCYSTEDKPNWEAKKGGE